MAERFANRVNSKTTSRAAVLSLLCVMRLMAVILGCLALLSKISQAQRDSTSRTLPKGVAARTWIIPVAVGVSVALDEEAREGALGSHTRALDRLAKFANPLGTARRLVPAMALTFAGALATHRKSLATGTLNTAAGYAAADLVESLLKPIVGRERPHAEGNSRRFRPLTENGDWHSFPSAHVSHIASIVEAVSQQTQSTPISAIGDVLVALVGWDRVYEDQHWASDVVATAALSSMASRITVRWLESRWPH
jgi:membrane-associated phospholipid phosphatase